MSRVHPQTHTLQCDSSSSSLPRSWTFQRVGKEGRVFPSPHLPVCVSPVNHACTHPVEPGYRAQHLNTQPPSPSRGLDNAAADEYLILLGRCQPFGISCKRAKQGGRARCGMACLFNASALATYDVIIIVQLSECALLKGRTGRATRSETLQ